MTVYEYGDERIVVDAGLAFPRDEHLGVDLILPDFGVPARQAPVRAVVLTHAHEDHVGALPYLLRELRWTEVWATRLTLGLVKSKLDEHGLLRATELREAEPEAAPPARAVQARVRPHGALDPRRRRRRDRDRRRAPLPTATGSSTTRPSTA